MEKGCYTNREISWLKFNERVLEEAENSSVPLCERLSFISIFQNNLDEFYMVRVGTLHDQMLLKEDIRENKTNMTPGEQISAILRETQRLYRKRDKIYKEIMTQIAKEGIQLLLFKDLTENQARYLEMYFYNGVLPLLTPMIVGRKQPFPFMRNQEIYAVVVMETMRGKEKIGIVSYAENISDRMIAIPSRPGCYILLEELILHFIPEIFKQYTIKGKSLVKITRNADINAESVMDDDDVDYREMMSEILKMRKKLSPVRLELTRILDIKVVQSLCYYLGIKRSQVFISNVPLDMKFISLIRDKLRDKSELFYNKVMPKWPSDIEKDESIMKQADKKDMLLSYPYDSFKPFLQLLQEAASAEEVVSIKMTLYRLAKQSKIVDILIEAAENGKEVVAVVELGARFDEESNIGWSRRLEAAGCIVIYGVDEVKIHSKLCLITRKSEEQIKYITQIGTGNYNENTAVLYSDLSLITTNMDIGYEVSGVFTSLLMGEVPKPVENLLIAPNGLKNRLIELIDEEMDFAKEGQSAYIGIKVNSLTDLKLINKLIEASKRGVKIDLIIRGICCLIPGIEGETENIRVISIVGRFLEHSRIYIFGKGDREKIYISSADWMTRNTTKRIEAAAPILDDGLKKKIREMFGMMLKDNVKSRELTPNGMYVKNNIESIAFNSQEFFAYDWELNTEDNNVRSN